MHFSLRILLLLILTCTQADASPLIKIFVSTLPQQYFFEQIGADKIEVSVMVGPGQSPTTYDPTSKQIAELSSADLYQQIGVPFERVWLRRFMSMNPGLKIIDTQDGIRLLPMESAGPDHGAGKGMAQQIMDPHTWLSPPLVMVQARNILAALSRACPGRADQFERNYQAFLVEIAALDMKLMNIFLRLKAAGRQPVFLVFHPSWGYFARAYGLRQMAIETRGREPKPAELAALIKEAARVHIDIVLVQPQFSSKSAESVAATLGAGIVSADPLAYDWEKNLLEAGQNIFRASR
jgi:zinc transport system substrate-binding protein